MPRIAVISSRQLFLGRDDSQITKPADQGSYDFTIIAIKSHGLCSSFCRRLSFRPTSPVGVDALGRLLFSSSIFISLLFSIFTSVGSPSFPAVYRNK